MNKIKILVASLAAMFVAGSLSAQSLSEITAKYNEAVELVNQKQYLQAIPVLEETIQMGLDGDPEGIDLVNQAKKLLPAIYVSVGRSYASSGNMDEALVYFEKGAELAEMEGDRTSLRNANDMIGRVYVIKGRDAFNDKDYSTAADIFARGYQADPTNTGLGLNLAMSYAEMGDMENASRVYGEIIALGPTHSKYTEPAQQAQEKLSYYTLLQASDAVKENNLSGAIEILESAIEVFPEDATANMMLIQTANNMKNWDKVIERGEAAAQAQQTDELRSDAYFLLGVAYQNKENKARAIENFRKVTAGNNASTARAQIAELSK